jgi:hypothetical protein
MLSGRLDVANANLCALQIHLAHNHKKLPRDSTQRSRRCAIFLQLSQEVFTFVEPRSFPMAGYDGGILEQRLKHGQASYRNRKNLTKYQKLCGAQNGFYPL